MYGASDRLVNEKQASANIEYARQRHQQQSRQEQADQLTHKDRCSYMKTRVKFELFKLFIEKYANGD